jgi:hypothetical protein
MNNQMLQRLGIAITLGTAAALASGCSGGQTTAQPIAQAIPKAPSTSARTKAVFTVKIPMRKAGVATKGLRTPKYLSSSTSELGILAGTNVAGAFTEMAGGWQFFNVGPNAPGCTPSAGFNTCVVSVTAPVVAGVSDEFRFNATDGPPTGTPPVPGGNYLSVGDAIQAVTVGQINPINVTLSSFIGVLTTCAASATAPCALPGINFNPSYSVWAAPGTSANVPVDVTAFDYDDNVIADPQLVPFQYPFSFCDSLGGASVPAPSVCTTPASSPFTYVSGLAPTATGLIPAQIGYSAPLTGTSQTTTVTMTTDTWNNTDVVPANFSITTMVVSALGAPIGSIPNLSASGATVGTDATVTVTENGASTFTVANNGAGAFTVLTAVGGLPVLSSLPATAGSVTFDVHAVSQTTTTTPPTITITDANGTSATLPVSIGI